MKQKYARFAYVVFSWVLYNTVPKDDVLKHWWSEFRCAIHGAEARSKGTSTRSERSSWYSRWDKCWVMVLSFMRFILLLFCNSPSPFVYNFTSCFLLLLGSLSFYFPSLVFLVFVGVRVIISVWLYLHYLSFSLFFSVAELLFCVWTLDIFAVPGPCLFVWTAFPGFEHLSAPTFISFLPFCYEIIWTPPVLPRFESSPPCSLFQLLDNQLN